MHCEHIRFGPSPAAGDGFFFSRHGQVWDLGTSNIYGEILRFLNSSILQFLNESIIRAEENLVYVQAAFLLDWAHCSYVSQNVPIFTPARMNENRSHILSLAEGTASELYLRFNRPELVLHNISLARRLVTRIRELGKGLSADTVENASVAAWFSQLGYAVDYSNATDVSINFLKEFLAGTQLADERKNEIVACLLGAAPGHHPAVALYEDAWHSLMFGEDLDLHLDLLRKEMSLMGVNPVSKAGARQWFITQMRRVHFHTPTAGARYRELLEQNLARLEAQAVKNKLKEERTRQRFGGITQTRPSREIQTFFRTAFEYHVSLIDISDNKARIMISVNSILVSILISMLTYNYRQISLSGNPIMMIPILVFLIASLGSLIFAVLSSRPTFPQQRDTVFPFQQFVHLNEEEYLNRLDEVFRSGPDILDQLSRAIYDIGKLLDKKFRYLALSYNIFMVGFVVSVVLFLITYLVK